MKKYSSLPFLAPNRRQMLQMIGATVPMVAAWRVPSAFAAGEDRELALAVADFVVEALDGLSSGAELLQMYDTALRLDEHGAVAPGVVDKWELAPDSLSWTLHVRPDVYFHEGVNADGSPEPRRKLTAEDVKFSYERPFIEKHAASKTFSVMKKWSVILGEEPNIEVLDESTLRVHTKGPALSFPSASTLVDLGCYIESKEYYAKNGSDYVKTHPIGTGPYRFIRQVGGDLREFEATDYYWSGLVPDFKKLKILLVPEEATRISMLRTGQVDGIDVSMQGAIDLKKDGFDTEGGAEALIWMGVGGAYHPKAKGMPLSDIRLRQALSLAINRQEIIDTLLYGNGSMPPPARVGWNDPDMTPALVEKWKAWTRENYSFDPARAKQLIAEAGHPDGFTFDFWLAPDPSAPYLNDITLAVVSYWKNVGANAVVISVDQQALVAAHHTTKSLELVGKMWMDAHGLPRPDTILYQHPFTSNIGYTDLLVGSPQQAEFDELYAASRKATDPAEHEKLLDRAITMNTSSWTAIPLFTSPTMFGFGPRVEAHLDPTVAQLTYKAPYFKYTGKEG